MFLFMALYKVYYRLRFTDSARTMNLDSPTEGAAKDALVRQHTISAAEARDVIIKKIERA